MKKSINILLGVVFALTFVSNSNAQSEKEKNPFLGKWKVMAYGLPQGDTEMIITLEDKNDVLSGFIGGAKDQPGIPFTKIETENNSINVYYPAQGIEVFMHMEKDKDGKITGSLMDMFDLEGEKVVAEAETKTK